MLQNFVRYLCWVIIVFSQTSKCRRYDIEQEAINLYSTNLKSVIEKFRRTPEYLKILNEQMQLIRSSSDSIIESTVMYYSTKLQEKVNEFFGVNGTRKDLRTIQEIQFQKILRKPHKKARTNKKFKRDSKNLDNYKKFHSVLTLEQKNRMKELGFEYAGRAIHAMLSHILPDDALPMSTLHPFGGESLGSKNTIFHVDHEITRLSSPTTEAIVSTNHHHTHTIENN